MRSNICTPVEYVGCVHTKLIIGDSVIDFSNHNAGQDGLFKIILKALLGYSISDSKPYYLDLIKDNQSILSSPVYLSGSKYFKQGNNWVTQYSAMLPLQLLTSSIDSAGESAVVGLDTGYDLVLKSFSKETLLTVDVLYVADSGGTVVNPFSWLDGNNGVSALIEWTLLVRNLTNL